MVGAEWATQLNFLKGPLRIRFVGGSSACVYKEGINITGSLMLARCLGSVSFAGQELRDSMDATDGDMILVNLANVISIVDENRNPKKEAANV